MGKKKTPARVAAVSEAFTAAMGEGDWDQARDVLVQALCACEKSAEVGELLHAGGIDEVVFAQSELWPEVGESLVAQAQSMSDEEGALTLGWLGPLCGLWPTLIVSPNRFPHLRNNERKAFAEVVDSHIELYRTWSKGSAISRRVAAVHLMAWCANTSPEDAEALLASARGDTDGPLLATDLLTLGVMHHRLRLRGEELRSLATRHLAHEDRVVQLCACVALAYVGDDLDEEAALGVVQHVLEPIALPSAWQWGSVASDGLALAVLAWARTNAPEAVVRRLAAMEFDLSNPLQAFQSQGTRNAIGRCMLQLAFAGARELPAQGLAVEELDPIQRSTVEALVKLELGWPSFAVRDAEGLARYVEGIGEWKPIPITVQGQRHAWHFARILGEVVHCGLEPEVARDAVLGMDAAEAADLATRWSSGRVYLDPHGETNDGRILDVCLSIVAELQSRGFALDSLCRSALSDASRSSPDFGVLAIASLRAHQGELPHDLVAVVKRAIAHGWWKSQVMGEVDRLSRELRELVLAPL